MILNSKEEFSIQYCPDVRQKLINKGIDPELIVFCFGNGMTPPSLEPNLQCIAFEIMSAYPEATTKLRDLGEQEKTSYLDNVHTLILQFIIFSDSVKKAKLSIKVNYSNLEIRLVKNKRQKNKPRKEKREKVLNAFSQEDGEKLQKKGLPVELLNFIQSEKNALYPKQQEILLTLLNVYPRSIHITDLLDNSNSNLLRVYLSNIRTFLRTYNQAALKDEQISIQNLEEKCCLQIERDLILGPKLISQELFETFADKGVSTIVIDYFFGYVCKNTPRFTKKERKILISLLKNFGKVCVFPENQKQSLRVHIHHIQNIIESDPLAPTAICIINTRGVGYTMSNKIQPV